MYRFSLGMLHTVLLVLTSASSTSGQQLSLFSEVTLSGNSNYQAADLAVRGDSLYVLFNVTLVNNNPGIPLGGLHNIGSGVALLGQNGEILQTSAVLPTQGYFLPTNQSVPGFYFPANSLVVRSTGELFVPFSSLTGTATPCADGNSVVDSRSALSLELDGETLSVLTPPSLGDVTSCVSFRTLGTTAYGGSVYTIFHEGQTNRVYRYQYNDRAERVDTVFYPDKNISNGFIDQSALEYYQDLAIGDMTIRSLSLSGDSLVVPGTALQFAAGYRVQEILHKDGRHFVFAYPWSLSAERRIQVIILDADTGEVTATYSLTNESIVGVIISGDVFYTVEGVQRGVYPDLTDNPIKVTAYRDDFSIIDSLRFGDVHRFPVDVTTIDDRLVVVSTESRNTLPLEARDTDKVVLSLIDISEITSSTRIGTNDSDSIFYPNPTTRFLRYPDSFQRSKFILVSSTGQTLEHFEGQSGRLDLSHYPNGLYYVIEQRSTGKRSIHPIVVHR